MSARWLVPIVRVEPGGHVTARAVHTGNFNFSQLDPFFHGSLLAVCCLLTEATMDSDDETEHLMLDGQ